MKQIIIFSPQEIEKWYFQFRDALIYSLKQLKYKVIYETQKDKLNDHDNCLLIILGNPHCPATKNISDILQNKNFIVVLYETEPVNAHKLNNYQLYNPNFIWTYSFANINIIKKHTKYKVLHVPPGYSPLYSYFNKHQKNISNLPLCIVGNVRHSNRKKTLAIIDTKMNIRTDLWNHNRFNNVLNRHYISVNIHKTANCLEMFRVAPLLSSGHKIISEPSDKEDETMYKDFIIFANPANVKKIAENLVQNNNIENILREKQLIINKFKEKFDLQENLRIVMTDIYN